MSLFSTFHISASGLTAEKLRLDVIAGNLANQHSTRTAGGGPYRRRTVIFAEELAGRRAAPGISPGRGVPFSGRGVRVDQIYADPHPPQLVYEPGHPDADAEGYVQYPNVELSKEITDMITAVRSYEANTTVINTAKSLYLKALEIGR
ncbi:MAG TPA: flagellar basal body rod protein FlgC [Bacillota bacterium]|nr:flagellar basal body rod protein FlgC [Bacillota bacterium]HOB28482.1 flagellar basal body rod protein FlgC [Bacillota bacterium]HPZ41068.1 flagellar basal body rod protein FlgC [Bacillota bacterium]HQD52160.1 flagellar basal body rod protein FlgC [Bacillota bacterium]